VATPDEFVVELPMFTEAVSSKNVTDTFAKTGAIVAVIVVLSPPDTVVGFRVRAPINGRSEILSVTESVSPLLALAAVIVWLPVGVPVGIL